MWCICLIYLNWINSRLASCVCQFSQVITMQHWEPNSSWAWRPHAKRRTLLPHDKGEPRWTTGAHALDRIPGSYRLCKPRSSELLRNGPRVAVFIVCSIPNAVHSTAVVDPAVWPRKVSPTFSARCVPVFTLAHLSYYQHHKMFSYSASWGDCLLFTDPAIEQLENQERDGTSVVEYEAYSKDAKGVWSRSFIEGGVMQKRKCKEPSWLIDVLFLAIADSGMLKSFCMLSYETQACSVQVSLWKHFDLQTVQRARFGARQEAITAASAMPAW